VTTPPNVDPEDLSDGIMEDCCIYQRTDELFKQYTGYINSWVYFGSAHGVMISWPGATSARGLDRSESDILLGNCEQYDPRIRPWYLEATSAPRNVIVLVDASISMNRSAGFNSGMTRWELARQVAKTVVSTTRFSDAVAVLALNEESLEEYNTTDLVEGVEESHAKLLEALNEVQPEGEKLISEGLMSAFQILKRAEDNEIRTTGCQEVILLITDGLLCIESSSEPCPTEHEAMTGILEMIKAQQEGLNTIHKASVFVATIGAAADHRLAKHIACQNNATWIPILPNIDILEQMHSFHSFFANQVIEHEEQIIWSQFYEDFSGLGTMTTGTRPIFTLNEQGNIKGKLLGVVGYDIRLADLEANGLKYEEILGQLSQHIGACRVHSIDQCQLQILRGQEHSCPVSYPLSRCYKRTTNIFYSSISSAERLSFDQAMDFCQKKGGRLAEITSEEDQIFFAGISSLEGSWIGLNRSETSDWRWISGRAVSKEVAKSIRNQKGKYCAALDSSSVKDNVEGRSCSDELPFLCQFNTSRTKSVPLCQDQVHEEDEEISSNQASFQDCLGGLTRIQKNTILENSEFRNLRMKKNQNPVLCPLGLEEEKNPLEAQCCAECLNSSANLELTNSSDEEDEEDSSQPSSTTSRLISYRNSFHPYLLIMVISLIHFFLVI